MFSPIESSSIVSTSLSNDIQPPSTSNTVRDSKQNSKTRIRKRKKELLKKLNEEKIEIKMAPYRRRKPASTEYTTDEEDMTTYDVEEEELELNPDLIEKTGNNIGEDRLKTALIELDDFSSGTSSRSTKLIHGGVRYLQKAILQFDLEQYRMVKEALHERANLLSIAPHLSYPLPIMLPIYRLFITATQPLA
ncbi:UNVERIFIED_CONTAM: Glycerol-3-phosphate dehydrogenase [Trichonephila clavipes]